MKELGNSVYYYYELKKRQDSIGTYKIYLKNNIRKNLLEYYNNNLEIEKILELLDFVLGEKVISSSSLKNIINKIPIQYLIIKKFKINHEKISKIKETNKDTFINYLYLLFYHSENKENDIIFSVYFDIPEINDSDLFIQNYLEIDENCRNIFGDYFNNYIKLYKYFKSEKIEELFVYKIEFSNIFFQEIFMSIIYDHLLSEQNALNNLYNSSSIGNFFKIIVNYYFMQESSMFFDKKIEQIAYIPTLVPQNYSIKNFSSKRRKQNFKEFHIKENEHKYKLEFKNTYIIQTTFNAKYYDSCILIAKKDNHYDLAATHITIKKDEDKRFLKPEHELIMGATKINLENYFDIKIDNTYFFYILSMMDGRIEDEETVKDCDKTGIKYFGFDISNKKLIAYCQLTDAFITNSFPEHNCISLFEFSEFENNQKIYFNLNNIEYSKFNEVDDGNFKYIKIMFGKKNENLTKSQFKEKELNHKFKFLNQIKTTNFVLFLFQKTINEKEEIFIQFLNKTYIYVENEEISENSFVERNNLFLNNSKKLYMIYSKRPLNIL